MKNKIETKDLFKMYQKAVKKVLIAKGYNVEVGDGTQHCVNFTDDDSFRDWIMDKFEDKNDRLKEFSFAELTQLLMYNSMLQTIAWNPIDVTFTVKYNHNF